jgi:alanyl-tRNA synthetase
MSQGQGGAEDDGLTLDVHAISQLQGMGVPPTNDSFKYDYSALLPDTYG